MRKVPPSTKTSCWCTRSVSHWRSSSVRLVQPEAGSRTARSRAVRGCRSLMIMGVLVHRFGMVDHATDAYTASGVGRGVVSPAIQCDLTRAAQDARIPIELVIAFSRSGGVGFGVGRVGRVPIQRPFGEIAGHVVQ